MNDIPYLSNAPIPHLTEGEEYHPRYTPPPKAVAFKLREEILPKFELAKESVDILESTAGKVNPEQLIAIINAQLEKGIFDLRQAIHTLENL